MKIAIISDIHGNMQSLEAVLEDIKQEDCDKIFCLGDIAMAGPEPGKVVAKIQELLNQGDFDIIQGNTDEMLGANADEVFNLLKKANETMANAYVSDLKLLSAEQIEFLKNLPKQKEIELFGVKILLVHGSPSSNSENIFPNLPIEKVEEMVSGTKADVVFCGHTHQPCGYQTNTSQTVVNVGSVGRPLNEDTRACYVVLNSDEDGFEVYHNMVAYDKEKASELMSARGYVGAEKLAKIILFANERYPS
jgi:putative phosphoesterase